AYEDLRHELGRLLARRALILQRAVDLLDRRAHDLDARANLVATARLLLGGAMHLLRDVAHARRAAQHELVALLLLGRRVAELIDADAHALHQPLHVVRRARLLLHGLHDLRDARAALACGPRDRLERFAGLGRALDAHP